MPSYLEMVCATNACVVKPNSFFTEPVRLPNNHRCVPSTSYLLLLGTGIQNHHQGGENRLKGGRKKYWGPELAEESSSGHDSSVTSENMGQKNMEKKKKGKGKKRCLEYSSSIYP